VTATNDIPIDHQLVVFAINGLTTDMAMARHMPNTAKFFQQGGVTSKMRTTYDTRSSTANWIGVFHGASSVEYGCDNNGCNAIPRLDPDARSFVAILENDYSYDVQVFSEDAKNFNNMLERDEDLDVHQCRICSRDVFEKTLEYAERNNVTQRSLVIVHFTCLDRLGESDGYGLENYESRVLCMDKEIADLSKALWIRSPNSTTFIFVSNHGGFDYSHAHFNLDTITVPFAVWGYGFKKHAPMIGKPMTTQEVAPSLFTALNITDSISDTWLEIPISDIYTLVPGEYGRYDNVANIQVTLLDEEECEVDFTIKHSLIKNLYVSVRVIGSVLILISAVTMFH
jgi:hypothetical protein